MAALGYDSPPIRLRDGFVTDSGNLIYDCAFGAIGDARLLALALAVIPGVVDHGLFLNLASALVIAGPLLNRYLRSLMLARRAGVSR